MADTIFSHIFENGLVLVAEPMPWLESASVTALLPIGSARDPVERPGLSFLTGQLLPRGCGTRDSRQFLEQLDRIGAILGASGSATLTVFSVMSVAERFDECLDILADLLRRPHLPEEQLEEARLGCLHELQAVADDPGDRLADELRRRYYADPWGRPFYGTAESLSAATIGEVREHHRRTFQPEGMILGVAGRIHWPALRDRVGALFADWSGERVPAVAETPPLRGCVHLEHPSKQTYIGLAYAGVPANHDDYYSMVGAVGVLGDGISSRLFTELREKRGLCYSVSAYCHCLRDRAAVLCKSATSAERAQETLDVLLAELQRLARGVNEDELDRLKIGLKTSLIMQHESSAARSESLASSWYDRGDAPSLAELIAIIEGLTCRQINDYLAQHPPRDFTVVTLGPRPLEVPREVLSDATR